MASSGSNAGPRRPGTVRAPNPSGGSLHHNRRQSSSERLEELLKNARLRADSMATASVPPPGNTVSPSGTGLRRSGTALSFDEPSVPPDETTAFLSGSLGARQNSYSTITDHTNGRHKRSVRRRRSRSSLQQNGDESEDDEAGNRDTVDGQSRQAALLSFSAWWDALVSPFRSIELENKGSVARDHLALERTFLAWLRTSLAFASIGIAVTQLFRLNTSLPDSDPLNRNTLRQVGKPLGAAFLGISILILLLGYRRFLVGQQWIIKGKFPASRGTVIALVLVTLGIMILSLVVVIVIHPKE